ncbi:serine/threonine protein kinase [Actinomadura barringtoniae]|uniref:Serine/threonine protein kinase n=1 Tax=Actinomadura barringtoniae TaxID=1427535 RepID=A0A939T0P3_9ACTN|nr:serine/threonine-protein kinase [Actinomadura barringtoniae]MBO2445836.1 serine/threonine protein kinase [Actinomadura barringtoniae]
MTTHAGENAGSLQPDDPRELGPYRLIGRLGRGGMGTVFLGEDPSGRRVAVKVINRELAGEAAFRERFRREVTAARQVRRFCTAPVIGAELDRDPLYVVTEFIEGPSLDQAVADRGALPGSDLEGLAVGVATALAAIHGAGIVHRDLKPANVLLSSTGPRVIDFGIARALDAAEGPTRTGQLVGTPNYLPPELLRGEPITPASDVFSWGCVVAFAGTGSAPFAGKTVPEIFYRVAHEAPSLGGLDEDLRELVTAALDKNPDNRPSVQELLARLVGHQEVNPAQIAETVQASWHGPGPTEVIPPPKPTAVMGAETTRRDPPTGYGPPPTRVSPPPPGRSGLAALPRKPLIIGAAALAAVLVLGVAAYALLRSDGPPSATTFFSDDFSSDKSGWYGGNYTSGQGYENGHYRVDLTSDDFNVDSSPIDTTKKTLPKKVLVSASATVASGPDYGQFGVFCRGSQKSGEESGYQFLVRKDGKGATLRKMTPGKGTKELASADTASGYHKGKSNRIQLACEEESGGKKVAMHAWLNGSSVLSATDEDGPNPNNNAGVVTSRVSQSTEMVTVDYDDFEIGEIKG